MSAASLPHYSITELNQAIGNLLERGFAPRFLLDATVSRPQLKKGHLWMTLSDGQASISAVVWASQLAKLSHQPSDGDGVIVVGKLNFWANRASLTVQVLDLRPSLSTVLRQFEQVSRLLEGDRLPPMPLRNRIGLLDRIDSHDPGIVDLCPNLCEPLLGLLAGHDRTMLLGPSLETSNTLTQIVHRAARTGKNRLDLIGLRLLAGGKPPGQLFDTRCSSSLPALNLIENVQEHIRNLCKPTVPHRGNVPRLGRC